jgi:sigma-B regulation protein RsbQ
MDILQRNNVNVAGTGGQPIIFAHGWGCDQNMWRFVAPAFQTEHRTVLYDHVGAGHSDLSAFDRRKYATLQGYADDLLEVCAAAGSGPAIFVGHSVSAIIGVLAAIKEPRRFSDLVLIGPSPMYLDDGDYRGGFTRGQVDELLEFLDQNYLGWASTMGPVIMGNPDRPELGEELTNSFCRTDPDIAKHFARVTFLSDNRADLPKVRVPALVMQTQKDLIANEAVGQYVHQHMRDSAYVLMRATGHCPNLSAPEETIQLMKAYLNRRR